MDDAHAMIAVATQRSLRCQERSLSLLSEQAVVVPCSTLIERPSCERTQQIAVLMALLHGLLRNTTNGDIVMLSTHHAHKLCHRLGLDEAIVDDTIQQYLQFADDVRAGNPMAW
jgi:hypothetical protein